MRIEYNGTHIIDNLIEAVTWAGDVMQAARWVTITINNSTDGIVPIIIFEEGREIRIFNDDGAELFRGIIFYQSIDIRGRVSIKAYDENIYLTKNTDTRKFVGMKASDIIRRLCDDFGIETGTIADTGYVIPKMILRQETLWNMMTTALTETRKQTGRRFYIYSENGQLHVAERKEKIAALIIERGTNLIHASYFRSIEELRNRVRVFAGTENGARSVTARDQTLIDRYGLMQHVETLDTDATQSELKQRADELLAQLGVIDDEATVQVIGDVRVKAGTSVYVVEPMTGIIGGYYVSYDEHTFAGGSHMMHLTLSATDELPTLEYAPPAEVSKSSASGSGGGVDASLDGKYAEALRKWNELSGQEGGQ